MHFQKHKVFLMLSLIVLLVGLSGCCQKISENKNQYSELDTLIEGATGVTAVRQGQKAARDLAIAQAQRLYNLKKAEGEDLSNGPCLSQEIIEDWAFDLVHNPRQPMDDLPENQCSSYREGRVHHFVEFDLDGNLIRAE